MNRLRPCNLAALTALSVLAAILLVTGCAAAPSGSPVLAASNSSNPVSTIQPGAPADSGIAGCTALLGAHQVAARDYPRMRSQFARSQWPDLRAAGTSYVDLAVKLLSARAYGGETVWFYQRLSIACVRHGGPD
jgi:hypothetical protein